MKIKKETWIDYIMSPFTLFLLMFIYSTIGSLVLDNKIKYKQTKIKINESFTYNKDNINIYDCFCGYLKNWFGDIEKIGEEDGIFENYSYNTYYR